MTTARYLVDERTQVAERNRFGTEQIGASPSRFAFDGGRTKGRQHDDARLRESTSRLGKDIHAFVRVRGPEIQIRDDDVVRSVLQQSHRAGAIRHRIDVIACGLEKCPDRKTGRRVVFNDEKSRCHDDA